jgi:hypothetical protein
MSALSFFVNVCEQQALAMSRLQKANIPPQYHVELANLFAQNDYGDNFRDTMCKQIRTSVAMEATASGCER